MCNRDVYELGHWFVGEGCARVCVETKLIGGHPELTEVMC